MIQLLVDNPLLLLFVVVAIGYPLGRIKIKGSSLGVAAVLFVGLAIGALHPEMRLPDIIFVLGLVLFVYTIGLSSGPGFFRSLRRKGLRDNLLVLGVLLVAAGLAVLASRLLGLRPAVTAGMFAGSLTNTPALAGLLDTINSTAAPAQLDRLLAEPVTGYAVTYPMGVLGMILAIFILQRRWKIDYEAEAAGIKEVQATSKTLLNRTLLVTNTEASGRDLASLSREQGWDVTFGRMKRAGRVDLASGETRLATGDHISVIGDAEALAQVIPFLGEPIDEHLELDRSEYDFRRVFVSNAQVAGHRLSDLNLPQQFGAIATRVRRGDIEFIAHEDTVLELGDRVRVVARRENMPAVSAFFGDSYRDLSEIDLLTFGLGMALGMLLGLIPFPLPGGVTFKLGFAGGPLIVALIVGTLGRTGPIVWYLPYSANLTLRQIGLILLLAGIGTRAGYTFYTTFGQSGGILIFLAGMVITLITALLTLWIGYKLLKIPMGLLVGMLSGLQTQPAVLGFALEQAENDLPNIGYATVFPIATIAKILFAQLLLTLL